MRKEGFFRRHRGLIAGALLLFAVLIGMAAAAGYLGRSTGAERAAQLKRAIIRAAVTCYAAEGRYPEDLDYIEAHYGVRADTGSFRVHYELPGENVMPSVSVTWKGDG